MEDLAGDIKRKYMCAYYVLLETTIGYYTRLSQLLHS